MPSSSGSEPMPSSDGSDPTPLKSVPCTDNWVTANAISKETMKLLEQSGMFLAAYRHGIMEFIIEMIWSGEL
jgi:hypothetical protein